MKDRYLFRGKREDGKWVYGYFMMLEKTRPVIVDSQSGIAEHVDPATIGQCTGLKDDLGDLIFEGDHIEWVKDPDFVWEVSWGTVGWDIDEHCEWYINGNIHEEPEYGWKSDEHPRYP